MNKELESLCRRFISDNNLQFQYVDYLHFLYCLDLFGYEKQWYGLLEMIKNRFNDSPNKFLEEYYKIRDKIITDFFHVGGAMWNLTQFFKKIKYFFRF